MKICFNDMLYAFSSALDCVENELLGVTTHHSERVAYIASQIGLALGLSENDLLDLTACAVLHDNALTEYIDEEYSRGGEIQPLKNKHFGARHCVLGERNVSELPFMEHAKNVVLYHHENYSGTGPFGKGGDEIPLYSALIHLGDHLDTRFDFGNVDGDKYRLVADYVKKKAGILYRREHAEAFLDIFDEVLLSRLAGENVGVLLDESLPTLFLDYTPPQLVSFSGIFARIVDYKSAFTRRHSSGVAKKAAVMGRFYGYDEETVAKLFLAGALHDIGKLTVPADILNKPSGLTPEEYQRVQRHAKASYDILSRIRGFEQIAPWGALHHERLNGSGYPFGRTAQELAAQERMMAVIDVYQALREERPYKSMMSHEKVMEMLYPMADKNLLDGDIVRHVDEAFRDVQVEELF